MSSNEGNPVERLVYYFSLAIRHKINREIGKVADSGPDQKMQMFDLHEALISIDKSILSIHQRLPMSQIYHHSAVHTILQHVKEDKIHVIDLDIRTGTKYIVMLQDLASREHLECFKLTAVSTRAESRIQDTGMSNLLC